MEAARGTLLFQNKTKAYNRYRNLKTKYERAILRNTRAAWFRTSDTKALEDQFSNTSDHEPRRDQVIKKYNLDERAAIVTLIHQHEFKNDIDDKDYKNALDKRFQNIALLAAICQRQDTRREIPKQATDPLVDPKVLWPIDEQDKQQFPMICKPKQCVWCLGDTRKTYEARTFEYSRVSKMLDASDKHLQQYGPEDQVPCPHPLCKAVDKVLLNETHFKSHLAQDHKLYLRTCH